MSARRVISWICVLTAWVGLAGMASPLNPEAGLYRFPMEGNEFLISGTFGELRPNHFHYGLDVKTGGEVGKGLYAVRDGYVYRIKVSPYGYGMAIYLRHGDGQFSLYAHMSKFAPEIAALTYQRQFATKKYEQEIYLSEKDLPVKAGQLIGYSGNSGSSQGAHLHFEIRDADERALNPLSYFKGLVRDDVPPILQNLALQPLGVGARVNGRYDKLELVPDGKNGNYSVPGTVALEGPVGLEYRGYDLLSGAGNHCGINYAKLYLDGKLIYELRIEALAFEEKKFINLHFDYGHHKRTGRKYERCYRAGGNKMGIYPQLVNDGAIELVDDRVHGLRLELRDVHGNLSTVTMNVTRGAAAVLPNALSFAELTTLEAEMRGTTLVVRVNKPSTGHLQGVDAVYGDGVKRRLGPAWFERDVLYYLLDLNSAELPERIVDPITGKEVVLGLQRTIFPSQNAVIQMGEAEVYFPVQAVFDTLPLQVKRRPGNGDMYSDIYDVGTTEDPLRSAFVLNLKAERPGRPEHMVIAKLDAYGRWVYLGKEVQPNGRIYAASPLFGSFCVMADSLAPMVKAVNFESGGNVSGGQSSLDLEVWDDFSGINAQKLMGTMDGRWILFEYDAKRNLISHPLLERPEPGQHELEVLAYDNANNLRTARFLLYF